MPQFSPGTLLMIDVTEQHLDDPNIMATNSCAVPDHPVMSRLWSERKPIGTIVVGLTPQADRLARQAASQLHLYSETRNMARLHPQPGEAVAQALSPTSVKRSRAGYALLKELQAALDTGRDETPAVAPRLSRLQAPGPANTR